MYVCIVGLNPTQGSSFLCKSDRLGCVVLLCFVVCMTELASSFLPSASLINMLFIVLYVYTCMYHYRELCSESGDQGAS